LRLREKLAAERNEREAQRNCRASLEKLAPEEKERAGLLSRLKRYLHWSFPLKWQLKYVLKRKHRIPRKLADIVLRLALKRIGL